MIIALIFLFGLCFGSFANVLIDRIPAKKSVLFGRSQCDFCHRTLRIEDLAPVISFLFLRGHCRYCHKKLSIQYPLIEVATAGLFLFTFFIYQPTTLDMTFPFITLLLIIGIGFALTVMDYKYHILADPLLLPFLFLSFLFILLLYPSEFLIRIGVGIIASIPLLVIFLLSKGKAMGLGDVKLIAMLGFLLGFPNIIVAYYIAFLTGAIWGVILILGKKKSFHGAVIAFGPFLFFGAAVALFWGNTIWSYAKILIGF